MNDTVASDISALLRSIGFEANDGEYYELALTHSSVNGEAHSVNQDYERLEFLGDSLIGFSVSDLVYRMHPEMEEGDLSVLKASFIRTESEAKYALKIGLDHCVRVGPSFNGNLETDFSLLEDVFEAFIGALVLDQGFVKAHAFTRSLFADDVAKASIKVIDNPKSELQEAMQAESREPVHYRILKEEGPSNAKIFTCGVYFEEQELGQGVGNSKKDAETAAARIALSKMAGHATFTIGINEVFSLLQDVPEWNASSEQQLEVARILKTYPLAGRFLDPFQDDLMNLRKFLANEAKLVRHVRKDE